MFEIICYVGFVGVVDNVCGYCSDCCFDVLVEYFGGLVRCFRGLILYFYEYICFNWFFFYI